MGLGIGDGVGDGVGIGGYGWGWLVVVDWDEIGFWGLMGRRLGFGDGRMGV